MALRRPADDYADRRLGRGVAREVEISVGADRVLPGERTETGARAAVLIRILEELRVHEDAHGDLRFVRTTPKTVAEAPGQDPIGTCFSRLDEEQACHFLQWPCWKSLQDR